MACTLPHPHGLWPHFIDKGNKAFRGQCACQVTEPIGGDPGQNPTPSSGGCSLPPGPHGLCTSKSCPAPASMTADSPPSCPGPPHLPVPGPIKSHWNTGRSLSLALGASSPAYPDRNSPLPLYPAHPLPGSLITVSRVPSSQSCEPGAWKLSWIPPPSHSCPQDATLPLPNYLPPPQPPLLSLSLPPH